MIFIRGSEGSHGGLFGSSYGFNTITKKDYSDLEVWNKWRGVVAQLKESGQDATGAMKQLGIAFNKLSPAAQSATKDLDGTQASMDALKQKGVGLSGVLKNIGMGLLNAGIAIAASLIITGVVKAIDGYIHRVENAKAKAEELISEYQTAASKIDEIEQRLAEIGNRVDEINKKPLDIANAKELNNLQLESDELEKQLAIQQEIVKLKNRKAYTGVLKSYEKENIGTIFNQPRLEVEGKAPVALHGGTVGYRPAYKYFWSKKDRTDYILDNYAGTTEQNKVLLEDLEFYQSYIDQANELGYAGEKIWIEYRDRIAEALKLINFDSGKKFATDFAASVNRGGTNPFTGIDESEIAEGSRQWQILESYAKHYALTIDEVKKKLIELGYLQDADNSVISNASMEAATNAVAAITRDGDLLKTTAESIKENRIDFAAIIEAFPQLTDEIKAYAEGQISAIELQEEFNKALANLNAEEVADKLDSLVEAYEEYGDGSYRVEEALEDIESIMPGVTSVLYDEEGALRDGAGAALTSRDALEQFISSMIQVQVTQAQANYSNLKAQLSEVGQAAVDAAAAQLTFWQAMQGNFSSYLANRPSGGAKKSSGGGGSKSIYSKEYEAAEELANHYIELSELTQKRMKEGSDAWMDEQQKQYAYTHEKAELIKKELDRLSAKGYSETNKEFAKLRREYEKTQNALYDIAEAAWESQRDSQINALKDQKSAIEDLKDAEEKRWKEREEQLEYEISMQEAIISALQTYQELRKSFRSERADLEGQLAIAKANAASFDGTNVADGLFSEADYKKLTGKLDAIAKEADALYEDVLVQINGVTKDNVEELALITSAFERQYDLKLKEYEVAKQELAVARARKELENIQNERSVAMLVNGVWTWVADPEAVRAAVEAVNEAEADSIEAITELADAQREAILQDALDGIEKQKILEETAHEKIMERYEEMLEALDEQIDLLEEMEFIFEEFIKTFAEGINGIASAIASAISSIASSGSKSGSGGGGGGKQPAPIKPASVVVVPDKDTNITIRDGKIMYGSGQKLMKYASGGVAKHTGLAYMDGTPANPEVVFNSTDAAKLYNLIHNAPDLISAVFGGILPTAISAPGIPKMLGGARTASDNSRTVYVGEVKLDKQDSATIVNIMERVIPSMG